MAHATNTRAIINSLEERDTYYRVGITIPSANGKAAATGTPDERHIILKKKGFTVRNIEDFLVGGEEDETIEIILTTAFPLDTTNRDRKYDLLQVSDVNGQCFYKKP